MDINLRLVQDIIGFGFLFLMLFLGIIAKYCEITDPDYDPKNPRSSQSNLL